MAKWIIKRVILIKKSCFLLDFITFAPQRMIMMKIDECVFARFKEGDVNSFYEKMYAGLLTYTARLLGEDFAFLAEDCVQDAVYKAYLQRDSFTSPLQWRVFLYTCVRNGAISILRKGQARQNYLMQAGYTEEDLSLDLIEQETLDILYNAIEALPEKYRTIFNLSFEQGLKNAEVAKRLQIAESTLKKQKARLIELLRDQLRGKMNENYLMLLLVVLTVE